MQKTVLENGLTIVTNTNENAMTVAFSIFVGAGSFQEINYPNGIAHFIEHMVFKGTKNRTARQINEDMDAIGGSMNAYTEYEKTKFYCITPHDQWKAGAEIISDIVWNHTIPADELERERTVIIEEIKMYNDDPGSVAYDALVKAMNLNYANRQSIIGTPESVKSITRQDILKFIDEFYQPNNMFVVATGKVNHDEVVDFVNSVGFSRNGKTQKTTSSFTPEILKSDTVTIKREIEQASFQWGLFGPSAHDEYVYAADVVSSLLGGSMSSRLYRIIREEKGLAYTVQVNCHNFSDSGIFFGYVGLDAVNIDDVKNIVIEEFERLSKEKIDDNELQRAIARTAGVFMMSLEKPSSLNDYIGVSLVNNSNLDPEDYISKIKSVTSEDIMQVAQKYFTPDNWQFTEVIPK